MDCCCHEIEALHDKHGGYWSEHPDFPSEDWQYEVACRNTRRGYWEWVEAKLADREADNSSS